MDDSVIICDKVIDTDDKINFIERKQPVKYKNSIFYWHF